MKGIQICSNERSHPFPRQILIIKQQNYIDEILKSPSQEPLSFIENGQPDQNGEHKCLLLSTKLLLSIPLEVYVIFTYLQKMCNLRKRMKNWNFWEQRIMVRFTYNIGVFFFLEIYTIMSKNALINVKSHQEFTKFDIFCTCTHRPTQR